MPQLAYFLFFRRIWNEVLGPWRPGSNQMTGQIGYDSYTRALAAGADSDDLQRVAAGAAYSVAFDILNMLDEQGDPYAPEGLPGWRLMELSSPGSGATGRRLNCLHELLLAMDTKGLQGADMIG